MIDLGHVAVGRALARGRCQREFTLGPGCADTTAWNEPDEKDARAPARVALVETQQPGVGCYLSCLRVRRRCAAGREPGVGHRVRLRARRYALQPVVGRLDRKPRDGRPDRSMRCPCASRRAAPHRRIVDGGRDDLLGGGKRDVSGLDTVSDQPSRPVAVRLRLLRLLRLRRWGHGQPLAPRYWSRPEVAVARRCAGCCGCCDRARGGAELRAGPSRRKPRARRRERRLYGRRSRACRDDLRTAGDTRDPRRIAIGLDGRRHRGFLRGR